MLEIRRAVAGVAISSLVLHPCRRRRRGGRGCGRRPRNGLWRRARIRAAGLQEARGHAGAGRAVLVVREVSAPCRCGTQHAAAGRVGARRVGQILAPTVLTSLESGRAGLSCGQCGEREQPTEQEHFRGAAAAVAAVAAAAAAAGRGRADEPTVSLLKVRFWTGVTANGVCKDDRGWLRHSVTNPMAIRAQECHDMAFDSTNCHSSGILRSRMPQPWHVAFLPSNSHQWHWAFDVIADCQRVAFSVTQIAILISVVTICLVECHAP